jgi:galactokinase
MIDPQSLRQQFIDRFGKPPRIFSAPGRVNLIGEHTDYNEGFVLPIAADVRTYVAAAPTNDRQMRVCASDLNDDAVFSVDEQLTTDKDWVRYIYGVARTLAERGFGLTGADLLIASDVRIGTGLSSSAALEVSVGYALLKIAQAEVDLMDLALACQQAEHRFIGTRTGLMDQLAAVFGEENHAMFIDCRSLEVEPIGLDLSEAAIVICDTNIKHTLATSAYNERRRECEIALEILREKKPSIRALRDVTLADFSAYESLLPEPIRRRCKHVVSENERTLQARHALKDGDLTTLGRLMSLSHDSLRDDYEVSCPELDLMVELAMQHPGVFGGRMMGGGFGGCTVNLVHRDAFESFATVITDSYKRATGLDATIQVIKADNGVEESTISDSREFLVQ